MSILSEEIIEDLPITKKYLISKGFHPYKSSHEKFINKISTFIKYKIWNRFYTIAIYDDTNRLTVTVIYDRVTNILYIIYEPYVTVYLDYVPTKKILQLPGDVIVRDFDSTKVVEKYPDINTQYFFDILFTDILSDSKCEEIIQKFREQWNQPINQPII